MPTRAARLANGQLWVSNYTLDYRILLQLLRGGAPHAVRPGSCVEMTQMRAAAPATIVAPGDRFRSWRHMVTTIVRKRVSKHTFQTSGTATAWRAQTLNGHLLTRSWDRLTLPAVHPVGYNWRDVDLRSRFWFLCRRVLLQVHPLAQSLARN